MKRALTIIAVLAFFAGCDSAGGGDGTPPTGDTVVGDVTGGDSGSTDVACTPSCEGMTCGDDGCGGSCGSCQTGYSCQSGTCVEGSCVAQCDGKDCGSDGCSGTCGTCEAGFTCTDGVCEEDCVGSCEGLECGDDGCGGSCGSCSKSQICSEGTCVTDPSTCDGSGFVAVEEAMSINLEYAPNNYLVYSAADNAGMPQSALTIQIFQGATYNGPAEPGTYDLGGANYAECGLCILLYSNCDMQNGCEATYYQKSGTITIESIGGPDTQFVATINAVLEEVEIDPNTWESTPVTGGKTFCLTNYKIDVPIKEDKPEDECVTAGTGVMLNNNIADFTMTNCLGETVNLHSLCGKTAVWLIAAAGWCGACAEYVPQANSFTNSYGGGELVLWTVVGENSYGGAPTMAYCQQYATQHGLDPAKTFFEPSWAALFQNVNTYTTDSIYLPWEAVLDGSNMAYMWNSSNGSGQATQVIQGLFQ